MTLLRSALAGCVALAFVLCVPSRPSAHESPVDHVDRGLRIWVQGETLRVRYQLQLSERAALMQLKAVDTNADGGISNAERDGFFKQIADELAQQLHVELDGKALTLKPSAAVVLKPQFRQAYEFSAQIGALTPGAHAGRLLDDYSRKFPGSYRWEGPRVDTSAGPRVVVSEAPGMHEADGHPAALLLKFSVVVP